MKRAVLSAALMVAAGCSPRSRSHSNVFIREGAFPSPDGAFELAVDTGSNDVNYVVRSADTGNTVLQGSSGHVYSYWAFSWGDDGTLWVWNSDIGGSFWVRLEDGAWKQHSLDDAIGPAGYSGMPEELFERLPSSLREGFQR
jgi:hypothetical protein